MKKKMLVYAHYFYPDVASTGQILTELLEELQEYYEVTVIAAVPSYSGKVDNKYKKKRIYEEKYQNIKLLRVRVAEFDKNKKFSRIKNLLGYFLNAIIATIKSGKQDIVFTISQPPILGGVLGGVGKRLKRAKLIYNIQDFNPEQTEAIGYVKNRVLTEVSRKIDKYSCRCADIVVVVGRDMQEKLSERFNYENVPKSVVINNWIDEKQIYPLEKDNDRVVAFKEKYKLKDKFVFMYSGNIGLYYDLENIIKVIGKFKDRKNVVFTFVGDGTVKQKLVDYCSENKLSNVKFIPYQAKEELIYSLNAADVHIVTNSKGIKGISVPSKIYGIMGVGKCILGVLEEKSEARMLIQNGKCGICCDPCDYEEIEEAIKKIIDLEDLDEMSLKSRKYLIENYSKRKSIDLYIHNINLLLNNNRS